MRTGKKVIVITGPTATGKTALSVELCNKTGGEVISADSMQIYKGMDIGTAKVREEEKRGVAHHMVDVVEPAEDFSVSRWVEMAASCAEDIFSRGKTPVIVGGTGLYIDSLLSGRDFAEGQGNGEIRKRLTAEYDELGGEASLEKLRAVDSERAAKLHPSDRKRIVRALEVYELTGMTITEHDERTKALPPRYESVRFALNFAAREKLYERIDRRVDLMVEEGLVQEVKRLLDSGVPESSTAMQAIGYKELVGCLKGECSLEEALEQIKLGSRRYAKRQLTWLRRDRELNWIIWDDKPDMERALEDIIGKI